MTRFHTRGTQFNDALQPRHKTGLYQALMQMKSQLTREETELCSLTDSVS